MKRALISDIHANLEALTVVMADIRAQGIREIYCLGDIVGYGPNPCECLDALHHSLSKTELEIRNAASFGFNHARHKMAKVAIATMAKMINQAKPT